MTAVLNPPDSTLEERHDFVVESLTLLASIAVLDTITAKDKREFELAKNLASIASTIALAYLDLVEAVNERFGTTLDIDSQESRDDLAKKVLAYKDEILAKLEGALA